MRLTHVVLAALSLAAAACASRPLVGRPPVPPNVPRAFLHFSDASVGVGDEAPAFTLPAAEGEGTISLASFRGAPLVLVFASHT